MTYTTKLIPISDACHDGCVLTREPLFVLVARSKRLESALEHILKLTDAFDKAPVQSRSVERRYVLLIKRAVREALTGAS